jgi:hypothetical protein
LLRSLNNDEFIGTEVGTRGAPLPLARPVGGRLDRAAIDDNGES